METVDFIQMKDGTQEEYEFLEKLEAEYASGLADRIIEKMHALEQTLSGYKVSRLTHSLQAATRAEADGADEELVLAALVHDIGDDLAPYNHSQYAAAILRPYVRPEVTWIVNQHGIFQNYYFIHHYGGDRLERERYKDHPWYQSCVDFCEKYDQISFDPDYPTKPLEYFEPLVRKIFSRQAFDPRFVGNQTLGSSAVDVELPATRSQC